jgi:hypothetical protein
MGFIRKTLNPAIYHGHQKTAPFFEGWYYKLVSADESIKFAIIPGVFLGPDGFAFIQVLNGTTGTVDFIKYPLKTFSAAEDNFYIQIDKSSFQLDRITLNIDQPELQLKGDLSFSEVTGWPVSLTSPGVMGWYAWVPRMECYHGVLGFDHEIQGNFTVNGAQLDFTGGRGYIEKDWGTAFPEGYVWMQTNHFQNPLTSLTASIAMIPWLGSAFRGFIVGLWLDGKLYRFATYTGAKTEMLDISDANVTWNISNREHRLEVTANRGITGDLKGPTRQDMGMRVAESLMAEIHVKLISSTGAVIFEGTGRHGGLEIAGNIEKLLSAR